jgi:hypothetical protein
MVAPPLHLPLSSLPGKPAPLSSEGPCHLEPSKRDVYQAQSNGAAASIAVVVHKCQVHFLLPRQACELLLSTPRAQLVHCQPALRSSNSTVPYVLIVTSICAWIRDGRPCLPGACTRVKSEQLKLPTQMNRCLQLSHTRAIPKLCSSFSSNARVKYGDREALSCRSCVLYTS